LPLTVTVLMYAAVPLQLSEVSLGVVSGLPNHTLRYRRRLLPLSAAKKKRPGPEPSLSRSEVLTLTTFARWSRFNSERDFYRYADAKLRDAFPTLPDRSQFNRLVRSSTELIEAFALHLMSVLTDARGKHPYQALDSSAMPIRDCKRRGHGWLAGCADIGWSNSLGWYEKDFACSLPTIPPDSSQVLCF
jgi:hypothetical protein